MEVSHTPLMQTDMMTKLKANNVIILDNFVSLVLNFIDLLKWRSFDMLYGLWSCKVQCTFCISFWTLGTRRKIKARMYSCFNRLFLFCTETKYFCNVARCAKKKKQANFKDYNSPFQSHLTWAMKMIFHILHFIVFMQLLNIHKLSSHFLLLRH